MQRPQSVKGISEEYTANNTLNGERWKVPYPHPHHITMKIRMLILLFLFNPTLEISGR